MNIERPGSPSATTVAPTSKRRSTSIETRRSRLASERPPKKGVASKNAFRSGELTAIDLIYSRSQRRQAGHARRNVRDDAGFITARIGATRWLICPAAFGTGAAATRHMPPSAKIDVVVFVPQISAAIRRLGLASLLVPENLYPVFRETEMRSNGARLPANSLAPDEALRPDLSDLKIAKARQDVSHQKLDQWIAAAIAELSDQKRAA